jgi:hypothetical protein
MARKTALQRQSRYSTLARGVKKRWSARPSIVVGGKTFTPQQIVDRLQALEDELAATRQAYAAWRAQVDKQRTHERADRDFVRYLGLAAVTEYADDPKALDDFGLEREKKPGPKTVRVKAAAAEKAKATRAERGTTGRKRRRRG